MARREMNDFLENIENEIDERIEKLLEINEKQKQFLRYLERLQQEEEEREREREKEREKERGKGHSTHSIMSGKGKESRETSLNTALASIHDHERTETSSQSQQSQSQQQEQQQFNLPQGIEDILEKAKVIRNMDDKRKKRIEEKLDQKKRSVSAPRISRISTNEAKKDRNPQPVRSQVVSKAQDEKKSENQQITEKVLTQKRIEKSNLNFIIVQSQLLSSNSLICPLLHLLPTKSLILSQYRFLTTLMGSPSFPPSSLFRIIRSITDSPQLTQEVQFPLPVYTKCIQHIRLEYEKSTQSKLNRVHPATMTDLEVINIFKWWYLLRKCIEAREYHRQQTITSHSSTRAAQDSLNETDSDTFLCSLYPSRDLMKLHELARELIYNYPLLPEDKGNNERTNHKHYHVFEIRVKYVTETILSKLILKEVLQELKECCALVNRGNSPGLKQAKIKWRSALKGYQSMETCLLEGATNTGPTIFFEKTNQEGEC